MAQEDSNTPLLNEYKLRYLKRTLLQTLFGGIRLYLSFDVPLFIYALQLFLWFVPAIIGLTFTLVAELSSLKNINCVLICGLTVSVLYSLLFLTIILLKQNSDFTEQNKHNFLAEEDELEFQSLLALNTLEFIVPKKKFITYLLHAVILGLLCSFGLLFLLPKRTTYFFGDSSGSVIYCVLGWLVLCSSCYPLVGQAPKEIAVFYDLSHYSASLLTRPFYVLLFCVWNISTRDASNFDQVNIVLYVLFMMLPLLLISGTLPPLDALILWLLEYMNVQLLGGCSMANDKRLIIILFLTWPVLVIAYFIPNQTVTTVFLSVISILLSVDCVSIVLWIIKGVYSRHEKIRKVHVSHHNISERDIYKKSFMTSLLFLLVGLLSGLTKHYIISLNEPSTLDLITYILISFMVLSAVLWNLMQVNVVFGFLKNPFHSFVQDKLRTCNSASVFHMYFAVFQLYSAFVTSVLVAPNNLERITFLYIVLMFRAYRMVWMHTYKSCFDMVILFILNWSGFHNYWTNLSTPLKLFIVSIIFNILLSTTKRVWFFIILAYNSITGQKSGQKKVYTSIALSVGFLPLTVAIVVLSAILNAPLLPLFTLPIFVIGFPRPLRIWAHTSCLSRSSSSDWIYYYQLMPSLVNDLQRNYFKLWPDSGEYYIGRFQDRLVWISILESGLFYQNFVSKGLELQETSCHSAEAQYIDDVFETSFNRDTSVCNQFSFSVLQPKTALILDCYSDAHNVLTGFIDKPETLENISSSYCKVLLWSLLKCCLKRRERGVVEDASRQQDALETKLTNISTRTDFPNSSSETLTMRQSSSFIREEMRFHHQHAVVKSSAQTTQVFNSDTYDGDENDRDDDYEGGDNNDGDDDEFGNFGFDSDCSSDGKDADASNYDMNDNISTHEMGDCLLEASLILDPPYNWKIGLPYDDYRLSSYFSCLRQDWFNMVIKSFKLANEKDILRDKMLFRVYRHLVLNLHYLINVVSVMENSIVKEGPRHVYRVFHGQLPWSSHLSWITDDEQLKDLIIKSFRLTFKLVFDQQVLGEGSYDDEILQMLENYENNWFIGEEESDEWEQNVLNGKPHLLSLGVNKKTNVYTSRTLSKQSTVMPVAKLYDEAVRGIWSALSIELYYMTNDDDERYSIQALPPMLRNITTQAADPPLGYPVYMSGLITLPV